MQQCGVSGPPPGNLPWNDEWCALWSRICGPLPFYVKCSRLHNELRLNVFLNHNSHSKKSSVESQSVPLSVYLDTWVQQLRVQQPRGAEDGPRDLDGLDVLSVPQSFRKHLGGSTVSFHFQGCRATKSRLLWFHTESCEASRNSWPIWAHRGPFARSGLHLTSLNRNLLERRLSPARPQPGSDLCHKQQ